MAATTASAKTLTIDLTDAQINSYEKDNGNPYCAFGARFCQQNGYTYEAQSQYPTDGGGVTLDNETFLSYSITKDVGTFDAVSFSSAWFNGHYQPGRPISTVYEPSNEYDGEWVDPTVPLYPITQTPFLVQGYREGRLIAGNRIIGDTTAGRYATALNGFTGIDTLTFTLEDQRGADEEITLYSQGRPRTIGDTATRGESLDNYFGEVCLGPENYCEGGTLWSVTVKEKTGNDVAPVPVSASGMMLICALGGLALARRKRAVA